MKKLILLSLFFLVTILPQSIKANQLPFDLTGFYLSGNVSCNLTSNPKKHDAKVTMDPGVFIAPAIGYRFCNGIRLEGEFAYRNNHLKRGKFSGESFHINGHLETYSGMANLYYDFPICWSLKPYVGAGIGYSHARIKVEHRNFLAKGNEHGFAWQVMTGVAYPISDHVDLAVEYRFFKNERVSRVQNHDIGGSLRYYF